MHGRVAVQVLPLENALEFGPHLLLRHVRFDHLAANDLDHVQTVFDRSGRGHGESSIIATAGQLGSEHWQDWACWVGIVEGAPEGFLGKVLVGYTKSERRGANRS